MHIQTAKGRETKKQTLLPSLVDRPPSCASAARDDEGDGHVLRGRLVGLAGPDGDVARGPGRPLLPPSPPQGGCEPPAGGRGGGRAQWARDPPQAAGTRSPLGPTAGASGGCACG